MECSEAKPNLSALALGSIGSDDEAELRTHVATCVECALELELLQGRSVPPPAPPEAESDSPLAVAPLAPPTSDWTVERIFGEGGVAQTAPPADAMSAVADLSVPTQSGAIPSMIFPVESPTPTVQAETAPPASSAAKTSPESWEFEPADAAREATPPEESLLFAEQALNRRIGDPTRKGAAIRAIFWAGSAVAGVGLLGVSLWMAMAVQQAPSREISARVKGPVPSGGVPATPSPSVEHEVRGSAPSAPTPDAEAPSTTPHPGTDPAPIKSGLALKSVAPTPLMAAAETKASPPKPVPPPVVKSSERVAVSPSPKTEATSPPVKAAAPAAKSVPPVAASPTPAPIVRRDDDEMWPTDDPVHVAPAPGAVAKSSAPPKQGAVAAPETPVPTPAPAAPAIPR
ncbi:MAG: zf-HC2 domain-containing protein, partial [Candidatus Eisenbacteria bacterium]